MTDHYRVLFYEPNPSGHHLAYLARMLPGFLRTGAQVILETSSSAPVSEEWQVSIKPLENQIEVETDCREPGGNPIIYAWQKARELRRLVRQKAPNHVCVCYADGIWQVASAWSYVGWDIFPPRVIAEGWVYRGGFAYPGENSFSNRLKRRLLKRLAKRGLFSALHIDDELLFKYASEEIGSSSRTEFVLTPNPVHSFEITPSAARDKFGIKTGDRVISTSGMISQTKGCDLLIRAFVSLKDRNEFSQSLKLLLVGPHSAAITKELQDPRAKSLVEHGAIISVDRFVNEETMYCCAVASDVVVACYPRHSGRSSIILWGAAAGRPVVATDWGCIGYVVDSQNLGLTCNVLSNSELTDTIAQGLTMRWSDEDRRRVRQYAEFHSINNYQRVASRRVARQIQKFDQPTAALN